MQAKCEILASFGSKLNGSKKKIVLLKFGNQIVANQLSSNSREKKNINAKVCW